MLSYNFSPVILPTDPDFSDLLWSLPFAEWSNKEPRLGEVQHGVSRHPVVFINYGGSLYVLKELPEGTAQIEYEILAQMQQSNLPTVKPVGYGQLTRGDKQYSILFTRYLEASIPFRSLFVGNIIDRHQSHLLDAISGLLVQLHANGYYWGDCSLSNILFRYDAGALQAYLVDAETAEYHSPQLPPVLRYHDLEIMQENISGELTQLQTDNILSLSYPTQETGPYILQRYRELWEEITRETIINQNDLFRVQERVRALNALGFSVRDVEIKKADQGNILKFRVFVSDRNFHRNQLMEITGLSAEERQAQQIINEINELKVKLSQAGNPDISIEAVAYHWLEHIYKPIVDQLKPMLSNPNSPKYESDPLEAYCQILEHKWYMSERAQHDVGHQAAVEDFIKQFS